MFLSFNIFNVKKYTYKSYGILRKMHEWRQHLDNQYSLAYTCDITQYISRNCAYIIIWRWKATINVFPSLSSDYGDIEDIHIVLCLVV